VEDVIAQLVERIQNRYWGKYRGFVEENADPEGMGRLRLRIPAVLGEEVTNWALPCLPFGGLPNQGLFSVPDKGAQVWVEFEGGDLDHPIWTGTFWQKKGDAPEETKHPPTTRQFRTPAGHRWLFEDAKGERRCQIRHSSGASVDIDDKGSLRLTDARGARVTLDAERGSLVVEDVNGNRIIFDKEGAVVEDGKGNRIEMANSGITVKGTRITVEGSQVLLGGTGGEPLIKGESFLRLFATHVHTSSPGGGPTSPPIPQGEISTLSMKVRSS